MEDLVGKTVGQYQIKAEVGRSRVATFTGLPGFARPAPSRSRCWRASWRATRTFGSSSNREAHAVAQLAHPAMPGGV